MPLTDSALSEMSETSCPTCLPIACIDFVLVEETPNHYAMVVQADYHVTKSPHSPPPLYHASLLQSFQSLKLLPIINLFVTSHMSSSSFICKYQASNVMSLFRHLPSDKTFSSLPLAFMRPHPTPARNSNLLSKRSHLEVHELGLSLETVRELSHVRTFPHPSYKVFACPHCQPIMLKWSGLNFL